MAFACQKQGIQFQDIQVSIIGLHIKDPVFIRIEPVGAKAPTFSSETKSWTFVRETSEDFALLCQAQAFPVPLIR